VWLNEQRGGHSIRADDDAGVLLHEGPSIGSAD
jgi:hypothetical protein